MTSFAETNASEVAFHCFLQWLADRSFAAAQQRASDAGMRIGLIADLAVGIDQRRQPRMEPTRTTC